MKVEKKECWFYPANKRLRKILLAWWIRPCLECDINFKWNYTTKVKDISYE